MSTLKNLISKIWSYRTDSTVMFTVKVIAVTWIWAIVIMYVPIKYVVLVSLRDDEVACVVRAHIQACNDPACEAPSKPCNTRHTGVVPSCAILFPRRYII